MTDPVLTFRSLEKLPCGAAAAFKVQGKSGRTYTNALFDARLQRHTFEMRLSEWDKVGPDITAGFDRPFCKFLPCGARDPETAAEIQALKTDLAIARGVLSMMPKPKPREEWNFKEWYEYARTIKMPSFSMAAKSGNKADLIAAVEEYEKTLAAHANQGASGDHPSPSEAAAA